jgi:hypothetical protein
MTGTSQQGFAIGSWTFSMAHGCPVRILNVESVWNHTVCEVWIPKLAKVERVLVESLAPAEGPAKKPPGWNVQEPVPAASAAGPGGGALSIYMQSLHEDDKDLP